MKKRHDQLLRNIYDTVNGDESINIIELYRDQQSTKSKINAELLESSALRASYYIQGFQNLSRVYDVAWNGQQQSIGDIRHLLAGWLNVLFRTTYRRLRMPFEFYNYLIVKLQVLIAMIDEGKYHSALNNIPDYRSYIENTWGWRAQDAILTKYENEHSFINEWLYKYQFEEYMVFTSEQANIIAEYKALVKATRSQVAWKAGNILRALQESLAKILTKGD